MTKGKKDFPSVPRRTMHGWVAEYKTKGRVVGQRGYCQLLSEEMEKKLLFEVESVIQTGQEIHLYKLRALAKGLVAQLPQDDPDKERLTKAKLSDKWVS
jgi:hypothetical protein